MKEEVKRRFIISGVSGTDPFTHVTSPKDTYLDGPLMNILRRGIKNNKTITDIYIYLTKEMDANKSLYTQTINYMYEQYNQKAPTIKFYPNDFYDDVENRLRKEDVHKFSTYYKEINEMYLDILEKNSNPTIYINISSGTPAFKADMMLMAVTNSLIVKQVERKEGYDSRNIENFNELNATYLKEKMDLLKENEDIIESRTTTESITQTKKVLLCESIKDSINKKDYCGIYNSIQENKVYIDNKEEVEEIAENLYYRYIGNDNRSKYNQWKNNDKEKLEKFYPIYKYLNKHNEISKETKELINSIIEKYNMLKVKSAREEINDWLLITVPLLEAMVEKRIESENIDLNKLDIAGGQAYIDKINQLYMDKFGYNYTTKPKPDRISVNIYLYEDILTNILIIEEKNKNKAGELKTIINSIEAINIVRDDRISAAHSIENIDSNLLQQKYDKLMEQKIIPKGSYATKNKKMEIINTMKNEYKYFKAKNKQTHAIEFIEEKFKCLIKLLVVGDEDYIKYLEESLDIYKKLEDRIISIIENEIYS